MKYILSIATIFVAPLFTQAHDGEHVTTAWYQEPVVIVLAISALIAMAFLLHGITKRKRNYVVAPAIALALVITSYVGLSVMNNVEYEPQLAVANFGDGQAVTLYKSPNCGCCSGHAKALEEAGFSVTIEETNDLAMVKRSHNIPANGESCHTSVIGDYVVEGHVPLEAIEKLLDEKPAIAGIGLAGMPIGTPGMPGRKLAPYEVYQLSDKGDASPYLTL